MFIIFMNDLVNHVNIPKITSYMLMIQPSLREGMMKMRYVPRLIEPLLNFTYGTNWTS